MSITAILSLAFSLCMVASLVIKDNDDSYALLCLGCGIQFANLAIWIEAS